MLLLPRSYDQFAGKSALLESWIQFGSVSRPPWMVAANDTMWKVLLAATHGGDVVAHVKDALSVLQPVLGASTPAWFALASPKSAVNASTPSTSRVDDVDIDFDKRPASARPDISLLASHSTIPCLTSKPSPCDDPSSATLSSAPSGAGLHPSPPSTIATASVVDLPPAGPLPAQLPPTSPPPCPPASLPADAILQANTEPSAEPHLTNNTADLVDKGDNNDTLSELSEAPSSPIPTNNIPKIVDDQFTLRRSGCATTKKQETPYPASTGNQRKRKKHGKSNTEEAAAPRPVKVQQNPDFIDLTLEDLDKEVQDTDLDLDDTTGFTFGDVEVSYPINSESPAFTWLPKFHLAADLKWFYKLDDAVRRSTGIGRPSPIMMLTRDKYQNAMHAELLEMHRTKACIHVIALSSIDTGFTEEAFSEICNVDEITTLHDFTVNNGARTRRGTVRDLLAAASLDPPKALSALHLPALYNMYPKLPISSDWFAWLKVQGKVYCRASKLYPVPEMCWAIASTGSAHHFWHIDANGLTVPKNGDFRIFMRPDVMTSFKLDEANEDLWDVHVMVLAAGDFLSMRAGLPHCVVTPVSSICTGGHFKAVTTIPESIVGSYHHLIGSTSYSNTDHFSASHSILMCLLVYYQCELMGPSPGKTRSPHVPDLSKWDGFLAVLYLCIYFELSSALVLWDYAGNEWAFEASIKNRTRSRSFMYWIFSNHQFVLPSGTITGLDAMQSIFCSFLAHHTHLLIHYKQLAVAAKVNGSLASMTLADLAKAISSCVQGGPAWSMFVSDNTPHRRGTFAWHGPEYDIVRCPEAVDYEFPFTHGYVFGNLAVAASFGLNVPQPVIDALTPSLDTEGTSSDDESEVDLKIKGARRKAKKRARS
ncbi:hypothetical protein DXG01_011188 [Tephrocybe rancida]|nr:hypothetical protein DXG01_011188 [Tephrocybe rancida]